MFTFSFKDDDLINQAIGIKPKKRKFVENQIDENELKHILAKGNICQHFFNMHEIHMYSI